MTRLWLLLFSLLTWGHCQIIYPDQYEIMKAASNPPYAYINDGPASTSNRQPTQYDQQFNPQLATTAQAAPTARPLSGASQTQYYPSAIVTTPAPSPQPLPQDWATHVSRYKPLFARCGYLTNLCKNNQSSNAYVLVKL